MSLFLLISGIILIILLVVIHEFGHFIMARRSGVVVEEFGIGIPPRALVLTTKKGIVYTLNWIPLGGFVKLKGENDSDTAPGSYGAASLFNKIKIMLAGVIMNVFAAFILLTFLSLIGMPQLIDNQFTIKSDTRVVKNEILIGGVEKDSPAEKAGLKSRDRIMSIGQNYSDQQRVDSIDNLPKLTKSLAGKKAVLYYQRNSRIDYTTVNLRSSSEVEASLNTSNSKGYLGVYPTEYKLLRSTWSAPLVAVGFIKQFTVLTFKALGTAVSSIFHGHVKAASTQVAGPIGIFVLIKDGSSLGYQFILMIVAVISLTLAIMNVLPIPALDGGRLFVTLIFHFFRRPLPKNTENIIHRLGFLFLMILAILVTISDITKRNF